jgi:hypothetical protein
MFSFVAPNPSQPARICCRLCEYKKFYSIFNFSLLSAHSFILAVAACRDGGEGKTIRFLFNSRLPRSTAFVEDDDDDDRNDEDDTKMHGKFIDLKDTHRFIK